MNQEIVNSDSKVPQTTAMFADVDMSDILLPKLLLMQGLSILVSDERAKAGDIVDSLTGEVLGGKDKAVEIIPFYMTRSFVVSERMGEKFEFKGIVPCDSTNAHWREKDHREEKVNGVITRRDYSLDFYCLLANQPDSLPYQISFRRTSNRAGKQLNTQMMLGTALKRKPESYHLGCKKTENDMGVYYVFEISKGKFLTPAQTEHVAKWTALIKAGAVKVAEEGDVAVDKTHDVEKF